MSSGQGNNQGRGKQPLNHSEIIAKSISGLVDRLNHALTIRQESTTENKDYYSEETRSRAAQLSAAQKLNNITITSSVVAFLALIAVYMQYVQSRETFEAGQRAWVLVIKTPIVSMSKGFPTDVNQIASEPLAPNTDLAVPIIFKNTGLSPAKNVHMHVDAGSFVGQACRIPGLQSPYDSSIVIAPGEIASNVNQRFNLDFPCVEALNLGKATYIVTGKIWYDDIFHRKHETSFCYRYEGLPGTGHVSACPYGNDAS